MPELREFPHTSFITKATLMSVEDKVSKAGRDYWLLKWRVVGTPYWITDIMVLSPQTEWKWKELVRAFVKNPEKSMGSFQAPDILQRFIGKTCGIEFRRFDGDVKVRYSPPGWRVRFFLPKGWHDARAQ